MTEDDTAGGREQKARGNGTAMGWTGQRYFFCRYRVPKIPSLISLRDARRLLVSIHNLARLCDSRCSGTPRLKDVACTHVPSEPRTYISATIYRVIEPFNPS